MMTNTELSNEFDVLASSYFHEGGFTVSDSSMLAFNEYEKSVFLTNEQEKLVVALYSGNGSYGGFEVTEQVRRDLDNLLTEAVLEPFTGETIHIIDDSQVFVLPDGTGENPKLWYIVYEAGRYDDDEYNKKCPKAKVVSGFPVEVVPVAYDDLHRTSSNPFRGPNTRRALRLDKGKDSVNRVEILSKYNLGKYYVKYIRRPKPIILTNLGPDVSINGCHTESECELHDTLQRLILEYAVRAALSTRVNQRSGEDSKS